MNEKKDKEHLLFVENPWKFCPSCGSKLLKVEKQKFCIKCGVNLSLIKENVISEDISPSTNRTYSFQQEAISNKIADEEILNIDKKKIWNSLISIGIPIAAFLVMNLLAVIIITFLLASIFSVEDLTNFLLNPYFLIIISFTELIFLVIPVYYVGNYLQNPTLKNRLALLGLSTESYSTFGIVKEVLIGLGFAVFGVLLVLGVSISLEWIIELFFNIDIIYSSGGSLGDIDVFLLNSDILALVLLIIIMVLVIGLSEEVLFRGFMQKGLVRTIGKKGGIVITALVFSLIHIIGIFFISEIGPIEYVISFVLYFFPYFAISILLGLLYYWRKENLIAVVIAHGFYDALTIIIAYIYLNFI